VYDKVVLCYSSFFMSARCSSFGIVAGIWSFWSELLLMWLETRRTTLASSATAPDRLLPSWRLEACTCT